MMNKMLYNSLQYRAEHPAGQPAETAKQHSSQGHDLALPSGYERPNQRRALGAQRLLSRITQLFYLHASNDSLITQLGARLVTL